MNQARPSRRLKENQLKRKTRTTHGGTVLTGDPTFICRGREVARVGDAVSCPRCKRIGKIVTGAPTMFDGPPVARHDDITDCGAKLIASQFTNTYTDASVGSASATLASKPEAYQADAAASEPAQVDGDELFAVRFQAINPDTGSPSPKCVYILTREDGSQHGGIADGDGFTEVIEAAQPERVAVHFMFRSPLGDNIEREDLVARLTLKRPTSRLAPSTPGPLFDAQRAAAVKTVQVKVDHKAATRQAIIVALRGDGLIFKSRSDWKAKPDKNSDGPEWDYHGVALHHAGNSFSCAAAGAAQMRKAEGIDLSSFGHLNYHYAVACDGTIYEALDIRGNGAHIASGNTGVVGVVMLADLTARDEAYKEGYADKSLFGKLRGAYKWVRDQLAVGGQGMCW